MSRRKIIIFTLILVLTTNLAVLLDIYYLREFLVFFSLTIIPGLLFLKLLNIKNVNNNWEKLVITIGISYSFTIFLGLFTNFFFMIFTTKPLTTINLLLSFDFMISILLTALILKSDGHENRCNYKYLLTNLALKLTSYDMLALILVVIIPFLSLLGSSTLISGYHLINLIFMLLILVLVAYSVIFYKKINKNILPLIIISISFSILLAYTLLNPYIYGSDSSNEFHFFKLILSNSKWAIFENSILDSSISISILPSVYQILSNFNVNYAFKLFLLFPIALNPLIIYLITKNYVKTDNFAFLAAIFIISQATFFAQLSAYRNYIAIFFFSILIMIMIKDKIDYKWTIMYIIFIFSAIVSHYTVAYILFGIFVFSYVIVNLVQLSLNKMRENHQKSDYFENSSYLTVGIIILIFVFIFLWHGQMVGKSFDSSIQALYKTIINLFNFYHMENTVLTAATGKTLTDAILPTYINFFTYWVSIIFISIGVILHSIKYMKNPDDSIMDLNLLSLAWASIVLFGIMLIIPSVFKSISAGRMFSQILVILSCFFVLGGIIVSKKIKIRKPHIILLLIVLLSFSGSSGLISQFSGIPNSILFNSPQEINDNFYIHDYEAYSAEWLHNHITGKNTFYSDSYGAHRLISITGIPFSRVGRGSLINQRVLGKGYLYLTSSNTINNTYSFFKYNNWEYYHLSDLKYKYEHKNLVYTSGASEIWYS